MSSFIATIKILLLFWNLIHLEKHRIISECNGHPPLCVVIYCIIYNMFFIIVYAEKMIGVFIIVMLSIIILHIYMLIYIYILHHTQSASLRRAHGSDSQGADC